MPLNRWRKVKNNRDGSYLYHCLQCDALWDSRLSPSYGGECQGCGTEWEGQHECSLAENRLDPVALMHEHNHHLLQKVWSIERRKSAESAWYSQQAPAVGRVSVVYVRDRKEDLRRSDPSPEAEYRIRIRRRGDITYDQLNP